MANIKYIRYALAALATLGVFALTAYTNAGDASAPTTAAEPKAGAAAPYAPTNSAPYRWQPRYPREDLPCNPPGTWEVYPSPTTSDLYCVDFVDANNGWAGGRNVALKYTNGTWTEIPGHRGHEFSDIDMLSSTDGWAVGWNGVKEEPAIWRWNGSDWIEFQNPTGGLSCIDMVDSNNGWIGGNGYFLRFNGSSWLYGGNAPDNVQGIGMKSATEGRAVGFRFIMRCSGGSWTIEISDNNWHLGGVRMLSASYGWACGQYGPGGAEDGLLLIFEGSWRVYKVYQNIRVISRLDIYQNNFGWCVGRKTGTPPYGAFIGFFDGNNWLEVSSPSNNSIVGIKIVDRDNAWIVGWYGTILKYKPNVSVTPCSLGKIKGIYR